MGYASKGWITTRTMVLLTLLGFSMVSVAQNAAPSPADCQAYAKRVEADSGPVGGGMARGAVRGAVFGGIVGGHHSARRGAAVGAVAGGVRRGVQKNNAYKSAYDNCMAGYVNY